MAMWASSIGPGLSYRQTIRGLLYTRSRHDPPAKNSITAIVRAQPSRGRHTDPQLVPLEEAAIVLCDVRAVAPAEDGDLLLDLGNVVVSTLEINLPPCQPPLPPTCVCGRTSLMATTSPVSLWTAL
jgi:hypothetical protein